MTPGTAPRRARLAPAAAGLLGGLVLALAVAAVPLSRLAHQSVNASGGSVPIWISAANGVVGLVIAWRRPRNALGWLFLAGGVFGVLSEDASFYMVADYRLRHGSLPFGWAAVLTQPGWAPMIVLLGVAVLLFPDGRLPARRWRWVVWAYLGVSGLWIGAALVVTLGVLAGPGIRVDAGGNLLALSGTAGPYAWFGVVQSAFFPVLAGCWLASIAAQAVSYVRSRGDRRQQLKWMLTGAAVGAAGFSATVTLGNSPGVLGLAANVAGAGGLLALPVSMGVAVFKYRLFDIDRIVSRTLGYAIVTGLLVGVYAGLVLLATRVLSFHAPEAVAAATLAAAALFAPVRRRVQHAVDRRFNRGRYDADQTVAAFSSRVQGAVDLDTIRDDLLAVVRRSLEPAHLSLWIDGAGR